MMYAPSLRWTLPALVLLAVVAPPGIQAQDASYDMTFTGHFRLHPLTGEGFTDELFFAGDGHAAPFGPAHVDGYSRTQSGPDGCATVVHDEVTVDVPGGSLFLVNSGMDCVDVLGAPGHVVIEGQGTTEIVGGTGIYAGLRGTGTWTVTAEVEGIGPGYAEGTFGPLRFVGHLGG